jgi:hypothetical protein
MTTVLNIGGRALSELFDFGFFFTCFFHFSELFREDVVLVSLVVAAERVCGGLFLCEASAQGSGKQKRKEKKKKKKKEKKKKASCSLM